MSDQPIRRVLFTCPPRPRRFQNMKTILKPKEELRSFTPVATPTSATKKRRRTTPFESTTLKDICDSSPVPLPIAAAAAAAAAAKHVKNTDSKTTVEEMMKAAGQVLNSHSVEESEESKRLSTPVRRKSVTFAEPVQVSEDQHSVTHDDFNEPELANLSGADDEAHLNATGNISATEADATDGARHVNQNHVRPDSHLMHRLPTPENRQQTENRKVGFEHAFDGSATSNGREMELERMPLRNNKKRYMERSPFPCNEEIKSRPTVFSSDEKVSTKHTTLTNDQERRGSEAFDSQPLEEEAESHIRASHHKSRWKATRAQSKPELKLSNSVGTPKEVGQSAFQEDSVKSLTTTESDTSELGSIQRAWKRSPRKRRLSEVLQLQKSLETAFWTDSRMVQGQKEAIVISDDESTMTPRGKLDSTLKEGMKNAVKASVNKERSKKHSNKESDPMVSRSMNKYDKRRGIVKPAKNAHALEEDTASSPSVSSRTRSKTGRSTRSRLQQKSENVPLSFKGRSKPKKAIKKTSRTTVETKKEAALTGTQAGRHAEVMSVRTSKSSKRKSSAPKHLSAQDFVEGTEKFSSAGDNGGRKASKIRPAVSTYTPAVQQLSLQADGGSDVEYGYDSSLSSDSQDDPLRDLVKVKLTNKMWQSMEEGWAVHNDITSRTKRRVSFSGLPVYVESPFCCGGLVSKFALELRVEE